MNFTFETVLEENGTTERILREIVFPLSLELPTVRTYNDQV